MEQEKKTEVRKASRIGGAVSGLRALFAGIGAKRLCAAALCLFLVLGTAVTRDSLPARAKTTRTPASDDTEYGFYEKTADTAMPMAAMAVNGAAYAAEERIFADEEAAIGEKGTSGAAEPGTAQSKIIRTASLSLVSRSFDGDLAALKGLCESAGGWIASSQESTGSGGLRSASLTLRIPSAELSGFLEGASGIGRVTRREESAEDVTEGYRDTETRLATQRALMARLQSLVTEAASLTELLELESQIADTQYTIDRLQGNLNAVDRKVDYATVSVSLREERPKDAVTDGKNGLLRRIALAFGVGASGIAAFAGDMLVFLAAVLPALALIAAVVLIIRFIRRGKAKR